MNVSQRRDLYLAKDQTAPLCVNCKHFYAHFFLNGEYANSGHCATPRLKLKYGYDTCKYFVHK